MLRELDQREERKASDWKLREEHKASDRRRMLRKERSDRMLKDSEDKSDQMLRQERLDCIFDQTLKEREERIDRRMRVFETGVWYYWWIFFMVSIILLELVTKPVRTLEDYFIII